MSLKGIGKAAVRVGLQKHGIEDLLLNHTLIGPANLNRSL